MASPAERMKYTQRYMESLTADRYRKEVRFIVSMLKRQKAKPASLIDIGCGMGLQAKILKNMGYRVVGVDANPDVIKQNKKTIKGIDFFVGDMRGLKVKGKFDAALCLTNVLLYNKNVKELRRALTNIHKVLKPGGSLLFSVNNENLKDFKNYKKEYARNYRKKDLFISRFTERRDSKNSLTRLTTWLVLDKGKTYNWKMKVVLGLFSRNQLKKELNSAGFGNVIYGVNSDTGDPKLFVACRKIVK
jgi:SAM-dependent methyltransferase